MKPNAKKIIAGFITITAFVACLTPPAFARDIRFEVTLDRNKVSLGSTANLNLAFFGTQDISRPELPDIHGFNWRYLGPSLKMSIVNGRTTSSVTHMYVLIPLEAGEFTIPPFSVYYNGKAYTSDPIPIEVVSGPVSTPQSPALREESYGSTVQDLGDKVFLSLSTGKSTAYTNELIPVTIKVHSTLRLDNIHYPELAHKKFTAEKFDEPRQYREVLNGIPYQVIEFNTNVYATREGQFTLGPAGLRCDLLLKRKTSRRRSSIFDDDDFFAPGPFNSFFGNYERYPLNLSSAKLPIAIRPLPKENSPPDFTGALGTYRFYLEASPKEVKVGDPITLKMTITGEGNFNTVRLPALEGGGNFKLYDPEVKQDQTGKIFEQVIIPRNPSVKEIPAVTFTYFDTQSGQYKKITRGPIPIKVNPLPRGEELKIFETAGGAAKAVREREILGRDIIYIKEDPGKLKRRGVFLCRSKPFIAFQFIPLLMVIAVLISQRKKERLEKDVRYARRIRAPRKARKNLSQVRRLLNSRDAVKFFDAVFKTLQEYLGDKFHLPSAGITSSVAEELKGRNVDGEIVEILKECFRNCDTARYAQSAITADDMAKTLKLLEETIDRLERSRI